jgi:hypothetical protein
MSYDPPWTRRPPRGARWWRCGKWALLGVAIAVIAFAVGFRAYYQHDAEEAVDRAAAWLDEIDPHWRWEEIEARRVAVPEEQNSARFVSAAADLLPHNWPLRSALPRPESGEPDRFDPMNLPWHEQVSETALNFRLEDEAAAGLEAELKALAPALEAARPLTETPTVGRFPCTPELVLLGSGRQCLTQVRLTATLQMYDACRCAHEGDGAGALAACRGVLAAGRALGDEPLPVSQHLRTESHILAGRTVERVLGQGAAPTEALRATQELFAQEEADSRGLLFQATRGQRALLFHLLGQRAEGEPGTEPLDEFAGRLDAWYGDAECWLCRAYRLRYCQTSVLKLCTDGIEHLKLAPAERRAVLANWNRRLRDFERAHEPWRRGVTTLVPAFARLAFAQLRSQVTLQTAQLGLAAERFRLAHGRWPERLDELVPEFLPAVPNDPYTGKAYVLRRRDDGLVIYSLGPDGVDNRGTLFRGQRIMGEVDLGFQLWDPLHRACLPLPPGELILPPGSRVIFADEVRR